MAWKLVLIDCTDGTASQRQAAQGADWLAPSAPENDEDQPSVPSQLFSLMKSVSRLQGGYHTSAQEPDGATHWSSDLHDRRRRVTQGQGYISGYVTFSDQVLTLKRWLWGYLFGSYLHLLKKWVGTRIVFLLDSR